MKELKLDQDEYVILHLRKHWLLFVIELFPFAIMAVIPFIIPNILMLFSPDSNFAEFFNYNSPFARTAVGAWLLIMWTSAWGAFTKYFLNAWILTSQRIINIKQKRFFCREVSSLFLSRVQDVTTDIHGVLSSLLNIGNINVQTAGATERFYMNGIPHSEHTRDLILSHIPKEHKNTDGLI